MKTFLKICFLPLAITAFLSACGGGGGDDAGERVGFLLVTNSTVSGLDGSYGEGSATVVDVTKIAATGPDPELCNYTFSNASRIAGSGTASGEIRYQPGADVLYRLTLVVRDRQFSTSSNDGADSDIHHSRDLIELNSKTLTSTDGSGNTLRASGLLPMRGNRPNGC